MDQNLIGAIYEAAFIPEQWPSVLDSLAALADARGGVFFAANRRVLNWTASESLVEVFGSYVGDGWLTRCTRRACLLTETRPGFLTEPDIWTDAEVDENPIYRDFLRPRGLGWSAGMALPLPTGDTVVVTFEREFGKGPVEPSQIGLLNALRPHIARSTLLAARLRLERASAASATLEALGLPALVVSAQRVVLAANGLVKQVEGALVWRGADRFALRDPTANAMLWAAVAGFSEDDPQSIQSFPVRAEDLAATLIAHVVFVRGRARDLFFDGAAVVVLTPLTMPKAPTLDLLRSLFDLTLAEARIAGGLATGQRVGELAVQAGVSVATVRSQLSAVLAKTGCNRQADLVALLSGLPIDRKSPVASDGPVLQA